MPGLAQRSPILAPITAWAGSRPDILGLAVVGSVARGNARPDSDTDVVLLVTEPQAFRRDRQWLADIGFGHGSRIKGWHDARYGAAWSRHVSLEPTGEIEFTFCARSWAATDPVDPGTAMVLAGGCKVLLDKNGLFDRLLSAVDHLDHIRAGRP